MIYLLSIPLGAWLIYKERMDKYYEEEKKQTYRFDKKLHDPEGVARDDALRWALMWAVIWPVGLLVAWIKK